MMRSTHAGRRPGKRVATFFGARDEIARAVGRRRHGAVHHCDAACCSRLGVGGTAGALAGSTSWLCSGLSFASRRLPTHTGRGAALPGTNAGANGATKAARGAFLERRRRSKKSAAHCEMRLTSACSPKTLCIPFTYAASSVLPFCRQNTQQAASKQHGPLSQWCV